MPTCQNNVHGDFDIKRWPISSQVIHIWTLVCEALCPYLLIQGVKEWDPILTSPYQIGT